MRASIRHWARAARGWILPSPAYDAPERRVALFRQLEDRIASTPQLRATLANAVPLVGGASRELQIEGKRAADAADVSGRRTLTIGQNYFDVLGVPGCRKDACSREAMATRDAARRSSTSDSSRCTSTVPSHWASGCASHPMPRDVRNGAVPEWMTIVGVVQNVRQRPPQDGGFDAVVYVPFAGDTVFGTNVLVRSPSDPALALSMLQPHLSAIDPDVPFFDVQDCRRFRLLAAWAERVFGSMFGMFGAIALVLATVGLYAITAYSASQRTREIGVRVALGAQASHVLWLVSRRATWQIALGLIPGLAGAIAVSRLLPSPDLAQHR